MDPIVSDDELSDTEEWFKDDFLLCGDTTSGVLLDVNHLSEMSLEDSERLYFYWKKLKSYNTGIDNESLVESLLRFEESQEEAHVYRQRLERYHYVMKPWNLREMSICMRCHLHATWNDLKNHKELEIFSEAEEQEHAQQVAEEMEHEDCD